MPVDELDSLFSCNLRDVQAQHFYMADTFGYFPSGVYAGRIFSA